MRYVITLFLLIVSFNVFSRDYILDYVFPQLPEPWFLGFTGVGFDARGNLFSGGGDGIVELTQNGHFLRTFTPQIDYPWPRPLSVAVDGSGHVYGVTGMRYAGFYLYKVDQMGNLIWSVSGFGSGDYLDEPMDVALDAAGNVYVADSNNCRVVKFDSDGGFLKEYGSHRCDDSCDLNENCPWGPQGLDVDGMGNVYVADTGRDRIIKFDNSGNVLLKFGEEGVGPGQFKSVHDVSVDNSGNIFIADGGSNGRIQKFTNSGQFVKMWGSIGPEKGNFIGAPIKITHHQSKLYVVDAYRLQLFDLNGAFLESWQCGGTEPGTFWFIERLSLDNAGNIYVADTYNDRFQKFDRKGNFIAQAGTPGTGNGEFNKPEGIAVDDEGNIYVADTDNYRVQKFNKRLEWEASITFNDGEPYPIKPIDVGADKNGCIYVLEWEGALYKYDKNLNYLKKLPAYPPSSQSGVYASAIDVSNDFFYFIADTQTYKIYKFDTEGNFIGSFGGYEIFSSPRDVAVDNTGKIYVADDHKVRVFNGDFTFLSELGSTGNYFDEVRRPGALDVSNDGNIVLADASNRVFIFKPRAGQPRIIPAAAHARGAYGKAWQSDLSLFNPNDEVKTFNLTFYPSGGGEHGSWGITLAPRETKTFQDVLNYFFGSESAFGFLTLTETAGMPPPGTSRTYAQTEGGTFGQGIGGVDIGETILGDETVYLNGLVQNDTFHTNIGFVNVGEAPVTLAVVFHDAVGTEIKSVTITLAAYDMRQENFILQDVAPQEDVYCMIHSETPYARYAVYASIVDNMTGDPVYLSPQRRDRLNPNDWVYLVQAAASTEGAYGTQWQSDLYLTNASEEGMEVTLAFYEHDVENSDPLQAGITLSPGESKTIADGLPALFGVEETYGALLITADRNGFLVTSRTYTGQGEGTFGQGIPALPIVDLPNDATRYLMGVREDEAFRSNLGLVSLSPEERVVTVTAVTPDGTAGQKAYTLPPYGMRQINGIVSDLGLAPGTDPVTLAITASGDDPWTAYISTVDNRTGDPTFSLPSP